VRCVSEFAMGLRELALIGQGAAWLPASLIHDDLSQGRLLPLPLLGQSVSLDVVVFFALLSGERGACLRYTLDKLIQPQNSNSNEAQSP